LPSSLCVGFSVTQLLELAANMQHCRRLSFICDSIHASATANVIHEFEKADFRSGDAICWKYFCFCFAVMIYSWKNPA
jgi:hypothetical protein